MELELEPKGLFFFSKLLMEPSDRDLQRIGPFDERFGPESLRSQGLGCIRWLAYVDLPTSPLAPNSMAKRWTPYPLASRSTVRSKYRSIFKALLRSTLSSHGTVNSTRMKESVAVDANTRSGGLLLSCSTLWQCLSPCSLKICWDFPIFGFGK